MKWFTNLKISSKLISAFIVIALIAGAMGTIGLTSMQKINSKYNDLWVDYGISFGDLGSIGININNQRVQLLRMIMSVDMDRIKELNEEIEALDRKVDAGLISFENSLKSEEAITAFAALDKSIEEFREARDKMIQLKLNSQHEEAENELKLATVIADELQSNIDGMFDLRKTHGSNVASDLTNQVKSTISTMIVIVVITVLLAVVLGIYISRLISNPVKKLVTAADKIADGDLDVNIDIHTKDEIGKLAQAFRTMSDNLNDTMQYIQTAAEQVAAGSKQISMSSISLSQGATEQASSVEELTSSIEEIASQTKQNANISNEANRLAEAAKENAILGSNRMKDMLNAMDDINVASQNISKIIKVIDEIAFQTNILALNAAVEAARAGQHGKGFAVVAEEVRNLAARSANAAKETTEMIEGSIKKADFGTKIANDTAQALQNIVNDVAKVADLIENIATASNEQAIGINQINQGIMQVSQVVQANSATSEEAAAASEELSSQAELLNEQVTRFKLRNTSSAVKQGMESLSPELMQLFEKMSQKKEKEQPEYESNNATASKIVLSDNEFGKY